jgi:hypothetical protein
MRNWGKGSGTHEHTIWSYLFILYIGNWHIKLGSFMDTFVSGASVWTAALPWLNMFIAETAILSREVVLLANFATVKWCAVLRIIWKAERWPQPRGNDAYKKKMLDPLYS